MLSAPDPRSRGRLAAGQPGFPLELRFCSIKPFYEAQGGQLRRLRAPRAIAEEMRPFILSGVRGSSFFQDDDFLATGARAGLGERDWKGKLPI